jgi:hypothetical protein
VVQQKAMRQKMGSLLVYRNPNLNLCSANCIGCINWEMPRSFLIVSLEEATMIYMPLQVLTMVSTMTTVFRDMTSYRQKTGI